MTAREETTVNKQYRVLVLDQPEAIIPSLVAQWRVAVLNQPSAGLADRLKDENLPDMLIVDYNRQKGDVLMAVREKFPSLKVIGIGTNANTSDAVKALRLGSVDFVARDINDTELIKPIWRYLEEEKQKECVVKDPWYFGQSPALQEMFCSILRNGRHENIVLIGSCGTGKEKVASIIHDTFAARHKKFLSINLALFPPENREIYFWRTLKDVFQRYESDVSGMSESLYETLYLHGLNTCSADFWATLLSILRNREADDVISRQIKVVLGLDSENMLEPLEYMLKHFRIIRVPSLAKRYPDIPEILPYLCRLYNKAYGKDIQSISFELLTVLLHYSWPGNIKELDSLVESMVLLSRDLKVLQIDDLPLTLQMLEDNIYKYGYNAYWPIETARRLFEKQLIRFASDKFGVEKASALLQIHSKALGTKQ